MMRRVCPDGFTVVEMVIVVMIAGFLSVALHQAHVQHRRFNGWQESRASAHDAMRVASSLLAGDLREAVPGSGDIALEASDSLRVRSPAGFGFVCAVDEASDRIGLNRFVGSTPADAGDSVLVYASTGWRLTGVVDAPAPSLSCAHGTVSPAVELEVVESNAENVPVGAPVRVIRSQTYHVTSHQGEAWFARSGAGGTEPLIGPLGVDGLQFRLLDDAGQETSTLADVSSVEVQLIVLSRWLADPSARQADTLTAVFQSRNR